jgi:DtxR family Mn-dependent transcriptional regulator
MPRSEGLPALTSAMEDYLEAIYHLEQERRIARVRDIAERLGVKMSSVSSALKSLGSRGHEILKRFLARVLKIDDSAAEDNACRIEHHLDPEVIEKLVRFVEFFELCPVDQTRWLDERSESCDDCIPCLDKARKKVLNRARAQKAALAEGMTLAETPAGSQVMIETLKGPAKFKKGFAEQGLETGGMVEIESKDDRSGQLEVNIKGYHLSISKAEAAKIFVKPI